jgi:hypothetical protein
MFNYEDVEIVEYEGLSTHEWTNLEVHTFFGDFEFESVANVHTFFQNNFSWSAFNSDHVGLFVDGDTMIYAKGFKPSR